MFTTSFHFISTPSAENLMEAEQNLAWNSSKLGSRIVSAIQEIFNKVITFCSTLYNISVKVVSFAVTGIQFTMAKVQKLAIDISQNDLNLIHIGDQITIHHHVVKNYYTCSHCSYQTPSSRQPLELVY
jgi:hypothetical protein